jgi:hypothetical protein
MFHAIKYIIGLTGGLLLLASCGDNKPTSLMPVVTLEEAQGITRYTAIIKGRVDQTGDGAITSLQLKYGTTEKIENVVTLKAQYGEVCDTIEGLKANTTYYYSLEAGNGYSSVKSTMLHFITQPNAKPTMGSIKMLSQGPLSIILQYDIKDNGGEALTETGFYYKAENGNEQKLAVSYAGKDTIKARIGALKAFTTYTVQAYASNTSGESRGETFSFQTGNAVIVTEAGMLGETIGESEKYTYTSLAIVGPLNGTDIRFLREMAGKDINDQDTGGKLSVINLADASIVEGGLPYYNSRFTVNNVISYAMFKGCPYLQKLTLPDSTQTIETNAFMDCTALETLSIPASATTITPSTGCTALSTITVNGANTSFTAKDGVLYNKEMTSIIWFPEGKSDDYVMPSTITTLAKYAFTGCKLKSIVLPSTIVSIPYAVFQKSTNLISVTLGSGTEILSDYCFEGCPLAQLHVKATIPPSCSTNSLYGINFTTCILYVPTGYKSIYRSASKWSSFKIVKEE